MPTPPIARFFDRRLRGRPPERRPEHEDSWPAGGLVGVLERVDQLMAIHHMTLEPSETRSDPSAQRWPSPCSSIRIASPLGEPGREKEIVSSPETETRRSFGKCAGGHRRDADDLDRLASGLGGFSNSRRTNGGHVESVSGVSSVPGMRFAKVEEASQILVGVAGDDPDGPAVDVEFVGLLAGSKRDAIHRSLLA